MSEDILTNLENDYADRLTKRAVEWQTKHPDEAKALREEVAAKYRRTGKPDPEPGSFPWMMLEAAVVEAIRVKKGWPTMRQFQDLQAGIQPPRYVPPKLRQPTREFDDHKAKAANDG